MGASFFCVESWGALSEGVTFNLGEELPAQKASVRYEGEQRGDLTAFSCPLTIEIRFYIALAGSYLIAARRRMIHCCIPATGKPCTYKERRNNPRTSRGRVE